MVIIVRSRESMGVNFPFATQNSDFTIEGLVSLSLLVGSAL